MMKYPLRRKIRSEEGASLSIALLLFLVCAILGVIILTAGTIASGRLADKAKMDQRYYKVTSVAEFLKDEFSSEDAEVIITRTKKYTTNPANAAYELVYDKENPDFLTQYTLLLLNSKENDAAMWESDFFNTSVKTENYTFNLVDSSTNTAVLSVKIQAVLENGQLSLVISNDDAGSNDDYKLKMTLSPDISEVSSKAEIEEESTAKIVETKKATVKWAVNKIEKVF